MARSQNHRHCKPYLLYALETDEGWRCTSRLTFREGESMVENGHAVRVEDKDGNHVGYQRTVHMVQPDEVKPVKWSAPALTIREMEMVAGLYGPSRTAAMTEEQRLGRKGSNPNRGSYLRALPAEDAVELAKEKFKAWTPRHLATRAV